MTVSLRVRKDEIFRSIFGGPSLTNKGGRDSVLKKDIFQLMEDGRERTTIDVCRALGRNEKAHQTSTGEALRNMARQGILSRDDSLGIAIWKKESFREPTSVLTPSPHSIPVQMDHGHRALS